MHPITLYIHEIRMEFCIVKSVLIIMRSRKRNTTEYIALLNQQKIRALREMEKYKNLRILEADIVQQVEVKE